MPDIKPTFGPNKRLARYIKPEFRQGSRRAKVPAFMDELKTSKGLSVNSLELNTENEIAAIYAIKFAGKDIRPLAITIHTVQDYNDAAEGVGCVVQPAENPPPPWVHTGPSGMEESYKHTPSDLDKSHCEVTYTPLLDEEQSFTFAHRLARKPTYKTF